MPVEPRGPLSEALLSHLAIAPHQIPTPAPPDVADPLADDDLHLALYCCYELHYRGLPGVDENWEWEPSLIAFRRELEGVFAVVLQGGVGGRIFERTADGVEHDWGEVTIWAPPTTLGYRWHLGRAAADATEVEIQFVPQGDAATRIEIEHRGWERLGAAGIEWRNQNRGGWGALLPHYLAAATAAATAATTVSGISGTEGGDG